MKLFLLFALFGSLSPSAAHLVTVDRIGTVASTDAQGRLEVPWGQEIRLQRIEPRMRIAYPVRIERWE